MKFYLSSFRFGDQVQRLKQLLPKGARIGHIINAQDRTPDVPVVRPELQQQEIRQLDDLGFRAESLDLRTYFENTSALQDKLAALDGLWISGGNTFVLRSAMRLSGFDRLFPGLRSRAEFVYAGYSAAICVICDSLKYIRNVDDPGLQPYPAIREAIWDGLGVFNYGLLPHYRSDHQESAFIEKDVQACIDNKWLFKVLRDGEVIILEDGDAGRD